MHFNLTARGTDYAGLNNVGMTCISKGLYQALMGVVATMLAMPAARIWPPSPLFNLVVVETCV